MKTDGQMISVFFEKTFVELVPQGMQDLVRQRRRLDFTNHTKGLYLLYKEPVGITEDDRITGIDPDFDLYNGEVKMIITDSKTVLEEKEQQNEVEEEAIETVLALDELNQRAHC
ncbi:hypothetical protein BD560DRAFT_419771 [Blakeslea trispora]|nr:hypothetical protein BD560DRAFT_419771 [Blakeslea trispora]